jgi:predicted PurR-regulated permease PerM
MALALYISLWVLELFGMSIPNKASLALILWLLDIIPYIWPIVGSIPAVIAWLTGFWLWGWIIVWIIATVINMVENNVLIPLLMSKTLWINTVVIFISMILGWMIMWLVGVLLAVPIAAIITLLFEKDF